MEFDIRLDALALLGRLAQFNPAYLLAPLSNVLKHIVVALKYGSEDIIKEQSTRMLCTFLKAPALKYLVHPYVKKVIEILPLKVRERLFLGDPRLATAALEALGWLSLSASELMLPFMDKLIPFMITSIQDSSNVNGREV
ncbi:unnamed protein product, partial [Ectocarpus sp. 12 AP-2014]